MRGEVTYTKLSIRGKNIKAEKHAYIDIYAIT